MIVQHGRGAWSRNETLRLVGYVRSDLGILEISGRLGRSPGAVRARLRRLTPRAMDITRHDALGWLRIRLDSDPGYDWNDQGWAQPQRQRATPDTSAPVRAAPQPRPWKGHGTQEVLPRGSASEGDGQPHRCPGCRREAQLLVRSDGTSAYFDFAEFPARLVPARLRWSVDQHGLARPAPRAPGTVRVHHGDLCPAGSGPLRGGLLGFAAGGPLPMKPGPPEDQAPLDPLPVLPVPADHPSRAELVARYLCPDCGAVRGMPCTTRSGRALKVIHTSRWPPGSRGSYAAHSIW